MAISDDLGVLIKSNFYHQPTFEQEKVIEMWCNFLLNPCADEIFLLRGYAGTGKTSLIGALVRTLKELKQSVSLLAPTGRAAKVFSLYADSPAYTIHKTIYRQKAFGIESFLPAPNLHKNTLFIVDEASMIANEGFSGTIFGRGRLLDDLIQYVYSCEGCRLILVGDAAQLPPVGEQESPALSCAMLQGYGFSVKKATLTEVVRQAQESGILWNATRLRRQLEEGLRTMQEIFLPLFNLHFPDICAISGSELIESLEDSYRQVGLDGTIIVTRSNLRAGRFNQGIRSRILAYEEELSGGEQVMVVKNNYFWTKNPQETMPFIANGDTAVIRRVRGDEHLYGFHFAQATLRFPDYDDQELEAMVLLDTLHSEAPALSHEQQETLFQAVWDEWPEIRNQKDRRKKVQEDRHFNALQIKYAYAVTCHKAQGGQWSHVYIDQGYITSDMQNSDYIRWLYTALTRATERVFLLNWPDEQIEKTINSHIE